MIDISDENKRLVNISNDVEYLIETINHLKRDQKLVDLSSLGRETIEGMNKLLQKLRSLFNGFKINDSWLIIPEREIHQPEPIVRAAKLIDKTVKYMLSICTSIFLRKRQILRQLKVKGEISETALRLKEVEFNLDNDNYSIKKSRFLGILSNNIEKLKEVQ